ncbi:MAG: tetraacyldisaccharide 4'-kinase [Gemmatimonadota bacterium]|nr:tetraacyldisaccharide 4'-kinase [Gemmatimonadota bacterium]
MRSAVERFAWRMWHDQAGPAGLIVRFLLLPVEAVWRLAARERNRRFERLGGQGVEGVTVISIGNVAVGGTGKTPVAAWFVRALSDLGRSPALVMRGYGADEAELHRRWNPAAPVEADADRVAAVRRAADAGADCVVVDDGFQHRRLARALDVVLVAVDDPIPGAVLPRGPYREPLEGLRRADIVIVTRRGGDRTDAERRATELRRRGLLRDTATLAALRLTTAHVARLGPHPAHGPFPEAERLTAWNALERPLVVTAIARPHDFLRDVEAHVGEADLCAFPDHHDFSATDAARVRAEAGTRPIVVTEKDAIKLAAYVDVLGDAWVVGQRLVWDWGEDLVRRRIEAVVSGPQGGVQ